MRLVPTLAHHPDARFLFAAQPSGHPDSIDAAPRFLHDVLDWLGIPTTRCHVVTTPVIVDELVVAPQAEQLGGPGPTEQHLNLMDDIARRHLSGTKRDRCVYVSRAAQAGHFAGEDLLEEALAACGVQVIRPETLPLGAQLRTYASARLLIFAEGSAMYGPLLLGRSLGDVVVLVRRPGQRLARPSLLPRSTSLRYFEGIAEYMPGRTWRGDVANFGGLTVLDEKELLQTFDVLDVPVRDHWDAARYEELCRKAPADALKINEAAERERIREAIRMRLASTGAQPTPEHELTEFDRRVIEVLENMEGLQPDAPTGGEHPEGAPPL